MEIEVGEYVRLARRQGINKIIEIDEDYYVLDSEIADEWGDITDFIKEEKLQEEILKHSKNIIDLIEVGDIVHTRDVLNEDFYYMFDDEMVQATRETIESGIELLEILTHEQFKQNAYRLEEK